MSYGMYQIEEVFENITTKVVKIVAFSEEAAIRSLAHLKGYKDPAKFEKHDDGSVRALTNNKTVLIAKCIRRYGE